ncbi:unnamed protein product [Phyllotreta striolata]|uniref:Exonuclease domain-containing protein n=1 Tax=Phyllotreta striolata TaxID=444603 RepID=A0A9N9XKG9_PHYSR|nr:unnamed protein product [Phyllotreta striolata]
MRSTCNLCLLKSSITKCNLCEMALFKQSILKIKTFVFTDIETTGLPTYELNRTKITELSLIAVQSDHLRLGVFPRVQNKLNLCFNPCKMISPDGETITGLSNFLLENNSRFSKEIVDMMNIFLSQLPQPVCFVAHNGFKFDFPILRLEIDKTKSSLHEDLLCVDSLICFRELLSAVACEDYDSNIENDPAKPTTSYNSYINEAQRLNETTPQKQMIANQNGESSKRMKLTGARRNLFSEKYKLGDVFTRLTNEEPVNSHQAEGDVVMLIKCAATLGEKFINWANTKATKFSDIDPLTAGISIRK